jgi:predicted TIM-barrel fold metal-dependent hydrolase
MALTSTSSVPPDSGAAEVEAALCLPPNTLTRLPRRALPAGTVDSHFHVFAEGAPLASPRSYTPQLVTLADWRAFADAAGIARGVLVQPSVYGFDNSVMLAALAADPDRLRGIAVVPETVPEAELLGLHRAGVRGVRCNTRNLGGLAFEAITGLARSIAPLGWMLQVQVRPAQLRALAALAPTLGVPIVLDHLGFVDPLQPAAALRDLGPLLDAGAYIKLSAPYRLSRAPAYRDVARIATALLQRYPQQFLWGSDWPHTELWDGMPDDADLIDFAGEWLADEATRRAVFVETPQRLFFNS